jgi:hypothetical protein
MRPIRQLGETWSLPNGKRDDGAVSIWPRRFRQKLRNLRPCSSKVKGVKRVRAPIRRSREVWKGATRAKCGTQRRPRSRTTAARGNPTF